ncbi:hypothetical protein BDW74DRAFT_157083 [Aspergillus multicolor]|uniref:uncharacterized protein n=1 Tax=Aspergillus multicolor TaxID=41759 RepID=UPI003CCD8AA7
MPSTMAGRKGLLLEQLEAAYAGQSLVTRRFALFAQYIRDMNHLAEEFWQGELEALPSPSTAFPAAPSSNYQSIPAASATCSMNLIAGHFVVFLYPLVPLAASMGTHI